MFPKFFQRNPKHFWTKIGVETTFLRKLNAATSIQVNEEIFSENTAIKISLSSFQSGYDLRLENLKKIYIPDIRTPICNALGINPRKKAFSP